MTKGFYVMRTPRPSRAFGGRTFSLRVKRGLSTVLAFLLMVESPLMMIPRAHAQQAPPPRDADIGGSDFSSDLPQPGPEDGSTDPMELLAQEEVLPPAHDFLKEWRQFQDILAGLPRPRLNADYYSLLPQTVTHKMRETPDGPEPVIRRIPWWSVRVEVRDLLTVEATTKLYVRDHRKFSGNYQGVSCKSCVLALGKDNEAQTFLNLGVPIKSVITFGHYLVFIPEGGFDAQNKSQRLSFVNLKAYDPALGNDGIPIFEISVTTNQEVTQLKVENGQLKFGEVKTFGSRELLVASELEQVNFNIFARMMDPREAPKVLPFLDGIESLYERSSEEILAAAAPSAAEPGFDVAKWIDGQRERLRVAQAHPQPPSPSSLKMQTQLADQGMASSREFIEAVGQRAPLVGKLGGSLASFKSTKRFWSQIGWFLAYASTPKSGSAQAIKEGLVSAMVGAKVKSGHVFGRLSEVWNDHKTPIVTFGCATAAAVAIVDPNYFPELARTTIQVGAKVIEFIRGVSHGTVVEDIAKISVVAADQTFSPYEDLAKGSVETLNKAYVADGKWYKTLIAVSAVAGAGAILWFTSHILVNHARLRRARAGTHYVGFAKYQEKVQRFYMNSLADSERKRLKAENLQAGHFDDQGHRDVDQWIRGKITDANDGRRKQIAKFFRLNPVARIKYEDTLLPGEPTPAQVETVLEARNSDLQDAVEAAGESVAVAKEEARTPEKSRKFWRPLRHFLASYATLTNTLTLYVKIWNSFSGFRYSSVEWGKVTIGSVKGNPIKLWVFPLKPKPITLSARFLYPNLFATVLSARPGSVVFPTELNGGMESASARIERFLSYWITPRVSGLEAEPLQDLPTQDLETTDPAGPTYAPQSQIYGRDYARRLAARLAGFQDRMIDIESQVEAMVTKVTLSHLPQFVRDQAELEKLYSGEGASSITSPMMRKMHFSTKLFMRVYYERVHEQVMRRVMEKLLSKVNSDTIPEAVWENFQKKHPDQLAVIHHLTDVLNQNANESDAPAASSELTLAEMRDLLVIHNQMARASGEEQIDPRVLHPYDLQQIVNEVTADPNLLAQAREQVSTLWGRLGSLGIHFKHETVIDFDPKQSASFNRYAVVQEKLEDPMAMARAVRSAIADLFVTLPLDVAFMFVLLAGVVNSIVTPIADQMFSSTAIFYGSIQTFYGGLLGGWVMSVLANPWVKIQEDAFHADEGNFGDVPTVEEAKRGFLAWYRKMTFHPKNSFKTMWKRDFQIIGPNIPAALLNIELFNWMFMGRMDLDLFIAGTLTAHLLPSGAFRMKIDQGFERSAYFDASGIPKHEYLAHPRVQRFIQLASQGRRNAYNLFRDLIWSYQFSSYLGNLPMVTTPEHGTRAFLRTIFGGVNTFDEKLILGARGLAEATANVPLLNRVTGAMHSVCDSLLYRADMPFPGKK